MGFPTAVQSRPGDTRAAACHPVRDLQHIWLPVHCRFLGAWKLLSPPPPLMIQTALHLVPERVARLLGEENGSNLTGTPGPGRRRQQRRGREQPELARRRLAAGGGRSGCGTRRATELHLQNLAKPRLSEFAVFAVFSSTRNPRQRRAPACSMSPLRARAGSQAGTRTMPPWHSSHPRRPDAGIGKKHRSPEAGPTHGCD